MAALVPFGKYRNQPVEVLAHDQEYCAWLAAQPWLAERFPALHTLIINNFAEPTETPAHNALQLRFLDAQLVLQLSQAIAQAFQAHSEYFRNGMHTVFVESCTTPRFEVQGIDVLWEAKLWVPSRLDVSPWDATRYFYKYGWFLSPIGIAIECKPSLGDDYPAVLRFMHSLKVAAYRAVIVEQYCFQGGTVEQVKALFRASNVLLLNIHDFETLPPVTCIQKDMLPPAEDYYPIE